MSCPLHKDNDLPYLEWHWDAKRRVKQGEKQRLCPKCGKWIWENLYREQDDDMEVDSKAG